MFSLESKGVDQLEDHLKKFASRALPFATKNTLNTAAFQSQKESKSYIKSNLTTRNNYTMQSIRVEQTKTLDISKQEAVVGSTADYMVDQEFGAVKSGTASLATSYAAGQGEGVKRTRLPRKANKLSNIQLSRKARKAKTRAQSNLFKIQDAVKSGNRQIYLDLGKRKGIFKVVGGKKKFDRGLPRGAKIKMLYDMTSTSVVIPKSPWLSTSVSKVGKRMDEIHRESLIFQLKRNKLLGY